VIPGITTGLIQGSFAQGVERRRRSFVYDAGRAASFTFTGTGVSWIGARGTQRGNRLAYRWTGVFVTEVDLYSPRKKSGGGFHRKRVLPTRAIR